jgi:SSS family solute:Na+ symporter
MDRMLHRGEYAVITAEVGEQVMPHKGTKINWGKVIGYDDNFTLGDKWLAGGLFGWTTFWTAVTISVLVFDYFKRWSIGAWSNYYFITGICIPVIMAVMIGIWFTWGGIVDSLALFNRRSITVRWSITKTWMKRCYRMRYRP